MRVKNILLFLAPGILAAILSYIVGVRNLAIIIAYFVITDVLISLFSSFLFISYWKKGRNYERFLKKYIEKAVSEKIEGKVAIVIPVLNEDPWTVVQTTIAAKLSCEEFGDVFVLDDSTDEKIRKRLDEYAEEYKFNIFRRSERRGYKAGAVNDWLRKYGDNYDFLMILDADQRPLPAIFQYVLLGFKDPSVVFI